MENIIEQEIKYLINKIDYEKILDYFLNNHIEIETINQINYYLETKNQILRNNKVSARLRVINDKLYEYTVKIKMSKIKNISIKNEFNYPLEKKEFYRIKNQGIKISDMNYLEPIKNNVNIILNEDINVIGEMNTTRIFFKIDSSLPPLNLDKNKYLGIEDYEIEWETNEIAKADNILIKILKELNVNIIQSFSSKNKRFQSLKGGENL